MTENLMRAKSVQHAEYEIIEHLLGEIDLAYLKEMMCDNEHSTKRFDTAAKNLCDRLTAMAEVRRKNLPKGHPDREVNG
jgi:tryptophan 2,3-dioxygenase